MIAPVDVTGIRIETPRLILRPWRESDLPDLYEYARVEGVGQMAGWLPHGSPEEYRAILDLFIRERKTLALEAKETGTVIGSLGLEEREAIPEQARTLCGREIGYVLSREYWGRGLMPEAVAAVSEYCFRVLGYDFLTCAHFTWNHRSRRVIEKCGFAYLGAGEFETQYGTQETTREYIRYNPYK